MSRNTQVSSRAPWILPLVLAVLIALIVLGVLFGSRIKSALNSPTATPVVQTVVITPTPGAGAGTAAPAANPAILPSATPSTNTGVVTPLPNTTPIPTVVGLQLDMITRPVHDVTTLQSKVDAGTAGYAFYLDPRQVVQNNLPAYGFTHGFEIVAPAPAPTPTPDAAPGKRPSVKFVVNYQSHLYTVFVVQPGKPGPKGIWLILTILPGRQ